MRRRPPRHKLPDTLFPYATHFRSQMTAWDDWLRKLSAYGKGGLGLRGQPQMRAIDRGLPYVYVMAIGMDVSADSFEASIRAAPDAAGAALADFDVTVGAFADGVTTLTLELSDTQTEIGRAQV